MKRYSIFMLVIFIGLLSATVSLAAQDGAAILEKVDAVLKAPKDMTAVEKMILVETGGSQKLRDIKIYQKGSGLRLVRFLSPADVRGVGFLRLADNRLYLYMPAFRKVRRIASSVKNENFMGTDFSYEDMSRGKYAKDYAAELLPEKNGQYVLELRPRPGAGVGYGKLILYADKENYVTRKVEYYDRADSQEKVMTVDEVEKIKGYWIGRRMEMHSLKSDHRTVLELSEVDFDRDLADDFFSERNLKRTGR